MVLAGPGDESVHAGGLADIQGVEMGFGGAGLARFGGDLFEAVKAPGAEQEFGAFGAESAGGGGAEAAGGAGDQDPFVFEGRHDYRSWLQRWRSAVLCNSCNGLTVTVLMRGHIPGPPGDQQHRDQAAEGAAENLRVLGIELLP